MSDTEAPKTGNVVRNTDFKSTGSWVNEFIDAQTNAESEVTSDEGKTSTVKPTSEQRHTSLLRLADVNKITYKEYPNPGMYRMNIGNMLRAAAKKRGGLRGVDGEFHVWDEVETPTHDQDGVKFPKETKEPEAEAA